MISIRMRQPNVFASLVRPVYGAMTDIADVPVNDKFQIITRHAAGEIIYPDEGYEPVAG